MNGYNTLGTISETFLTLLSTVAQGESEAKSEALKWSYRQRFKKGIPVNNMWAIMGYDTDENGKIFIIEKEAEIVRFMFTAYLDGKSTVEIAEALTMAEIPTLKGKARRQPGRSRVCYITKSIAVKCECKRRSRLICSRIASVELKFVQTHNIVVSLSLCHFDRNEVKWRNLKHIIRMRSLRIDKNSKISQMRLQFREKYAKLIKSKYAL